MKSLRITLVLCFCLGFSGLMAQTATEGLRPFVKRTSGNAISIIYTGQPKNVQKVLEEWFSDASGERTSNRNGFRSIEGARISAFSESTLDYYFKVDKVSRQDKEHAEVTVFISAGNDNFISSASNPEIVNEVSNWLESMQREVTMYEIELAIEAQEKVITKAQKAYDGLQRDSVRLQTTLAETLAAIEENKSSNISQRETIAAEKEQLQAFRDELDLVSRGPQEAIMRTEEAMEMDGEVIEEVVEEVEEVMEEAPVTEIPSGGGGN